ncbi:fibroblast growth factor receptor 4-like [Ostrinia nubilalis]|uniref:fibroblast growth factor receptor 4-like n=1 Tax=Ostrinia nubilalis TaxID=29057 RepID=UPI0030824F4A
MFQWNRLAVLSDDTEVAKDLVESLSDKSRLKVHNVFVSGNISDILESLRNLNSRIFFINTGPDAVQDIFCAANRLSMTDPLKYVWILRERRAVDLNCGKDFPQKHTHFTISYWWRGGNNTQYLSVTANEQNKTKNILRSTLDHLWHGNTWPPLAAPLVDSLEVLIKSFKTFTQSHPDKYYDLHGDGSAGLLLNSLEHQQTDGVMQNLHFVNGTLSEPLVFVDKWVGNRREPIFIWRIQDGHVEPITNATYGVQYPSDGTEFCLTDPHNDSFVPSCHDSIYLSALGFLIVATLALCLSRRLRLKRLAKKDSLLRAQLLAQRECMSSELADHYVDRAALELYDYLGQGCYGRVRYAIFRAPERQPISVAVKELRDDVPLTEESELLREACTLATLCHDHIVRLIGVCATDGPLLVLLEYAFFGNLCEYLCERRHLAERAMITDVDENDEAYHVSAPSLNRMAREIASALAYLALKRIVHRDVRASNCLVDARRSLKLADFGLARKTGTGVTGEEEYSCRRRGMFPVLWMAPESFDRGVFSAASDAWALGVLLLELVSLGARPYGTWPPGRVLQYVSAGGRPPLPPDVSETTRQLLVKLWRRAPELRLSAAALLARLEADAAALAPALAPAPPPADELCPALGDDDEATGSPNYGPTAINPARDSLKLSLLA